jgi:hypothetical protein
MTVFFVSIASFVIGSCLRSLFIPALRNYLSIGSQAATLLPVMQKERRKVNMLRPYFSSGRVRVRVRVRIRVRIRVIVDQDIKSIFLFHRLFFIITENTYPPSRYTQLR